VNGSPHSQPTAAGQPDPALSRLSLRELRAYRQTLIAEENRASYWRRLVQARLDLARSALEGGRKPGLPDLRRVLASQPATSRRQVLLDVLPVDDIPPLPDLRQLWEQDLTCLDGPELAGLERALAGAERELSDYRSALHSRLGAATGELVQRYRAEPLACLSALPELPAARRCEQA
jgi:hypothetical protein